MDGFPNETDFFIIISTIKLFLMSESQNQDYCKSIFYFCFLLKHIFKYLKLSFFYAILTKIIKAKFISVTILLTTFLPKLTQAPRPIKSSMHSHNKHVILLPVFIAILTSGLEYDVCSKIPGAYFCLHLLFSM